MTRCASLCAWAFISSATWSGFRRTPLVTESVDLVKRAHKRSAANRLVNAVLTARSIESRYRGRIAPTELSIPVWMLERWDQHHGIETAAAIALAALQEPEEAVNPVTGRRQDPGSQTIVPLLAIEPGMTVLDLCAAPGNKTRAAAGGGGRVVACDRKLSAPGRGSHRKRHRVAFWMVAAAYALPLARSLIQDSW